MVRWLPSFRPKPPAAAAAPEPAAPPAAPAPAEALDGGRFRIESYARTHEGCVRTHK